MRGTGASTAWSRTVMQQGQLRQAVTQPRQPTHTWRDQQDTWNNRQAQRSHDPRIRLSGGCRTRPIVRLLRRDEARGYQLLMQVQRKPSATDGFTEDSQGWEMGIAISDETGSSRRHRYWPAKSGEPCPCEHSTPCDCQMRRVGHRCSTTEGGGAKSVATKEGQ